MSFPHKPAGTGWGWRMGVGTSRKQLVITYFLPASCRETQTHVLDPPPRPRCVFLTFRVLPSPCYPVTPSSLNASVGPRQTCVLVFPTVYKGRVPSNGARGDPDAHVHMARRWPEAKMKVGIDFHALHHPLLPGPASSSLWEAHRTHFQKKKKKTQVR